MASLNQLFGKDRDIVRETGASVGQKLRVDTNGIELEAFELDAETSSGITTFAGGLSVTGTSSTTTTWNRSSNDFGFLVKNSSFGSHNITIGTAGNSASVNFPPPVGTIVTFSSDFTVGGGAAGLTPILAGNTFTTVTPDIGTGIGIAGLVIDGSTFLNQGSYTTSGSISASVAVETPTTISSDLTITGKLIGDADLEIQGDGIDTTTGGFLQGDASGKVTTASVTQSAGTVASYSFSKELLFTAVNGNSTSAVGDTKMNNSSNNALAYPIDATAGAGFGQSASNLFIQVADDAEAMDILGVTTLADQAVTSVNLRFRLTQPSGSVEIIAQSYYYVQADGRLWLHGPSTTSFVGTGNTLGSGGIFNASGTFTQAAVTFESGYGIADIVTVDGDLTVTGDFNQTSELSDTAIPVWDDTDNRLEDSSITVAVGGNVTTTLTVANPGPTIANATATSTGGATGNGEIVFSNVFDGSGTDIDFTNSVGLNVTIADDPGNTFAAPGGLNGARSIISGGVGTFTIDNPDPSGWFQSYNFNSDDFLGTTLPVVTTATARTTVTGDLTVTSEINGGADASPTVFMEAGSGANTLPAAGYKFRITDDSADVGLAGYITFVI